MSQSPVETPTQHALLVIWGQFAQALGLIQELAKVPLHQKKVRHDPHTKILEFFLAVLAGLEHLQDLSTAAEPIEKDLAVVRAWLQPGWADFSGVSRTLSTLTQRPMRGRLRMRSMRFPIYMLATVPQKISGCSLISKGPGTTP